MKTPYEDSTTHNNLSNFAPHRDYNIDLDQVVSNENDLVKRADNSSVISPKLNS